MARPYPIMVGDLPWTNRYPRAARWTANDLTIAFSIAFLGVSYNGHDVEPELSGTQFSQMANLGNNWVRLHRQSPAAPEVRQITGVRILYRGRCVPFAAASKGLRCLAVPRQQIFYAVDRRNRNMEGIDRRLSGRPATREIASELTSFGISRSGIP